MQLCALTPSKSRMWLHRVFSIWLQIIRRVYVLKYRSSRFISLEIGAAGKLGGVIRRFVQHLLSLHIANAHPAAHVLLAIEGSLARVVFRLCAFGFRMPVKQ